MQKFSTLRINKLGHRSGFSLIELLVVIAIIAILASIVLAAAAGLNNMAARKRAMAEITGMSNGLEAYKRDNGTYPPDSTLASPGPPSGIYDQSPIDGKYQTSSQTLFNALNGGPTFELSAGTAPAAGTAVYYPFKKSQVGNLTGTSYVQDPWGYPYGYCTGNPSTPPLATDQAPNRGAGMFDLWSTGGTTGAAASRGTAASTPNEWVVNW